MTKRTRLIIVAGPQSSGKSTLFSLLKSQVAQCQFLPEINPYKFVSKNESITKSVDSREIQLEILKEELERAKTLIGKPGTHIIETGIFSVVYLHDLFGEKKAQESLNEYLSIYKELNPHIVFIDTKPNESWKRRKGEYIHRIGHIDKGQKEEILKKYQQRIHRLYPLWLKYFESIPLPKTVIKNSYKNRDTFLKESTKLVKSLCEQ